MSGEKIFITGASSGLGKALAEQLAKPGNILGLVARRAPLLEQLRDSLTALGAEVHLYPGDVADAEFMARTAEKFLADAGGITTVIANAGIGGSDRLSAEGVSRMSAMMAVNVQGVIHTIAPFVPYMIDQGSGRIVAIGSVAGFRGLPGRSTYGASKVAVKHLMDGYRIHLRRHGIRVTTICPGFFESELTAKNKFAMPFFISTEKAARLTLAAVAKGKKTFILPWQWRVLRPLIVRLPDWIIPSSV